MAIKYMIFKVDVYSSNISTDCIYSHLFFYISYIFKYFWFIKFVFGSSQAFAYLDNCHICYSLTAKFGCLYIDFIILRTTVTVIV